MISSGVLIGRYLEAMSTPLKLIEEDMHCFGDTLTETVAVLGGMVSFLAGTDVRRVSER